MSKQRKFILIAAAIGIIAMFLPWYRVSFFGISNSVNGMHGILIVAFLCFIGAGAVTLLGDQTKNLDKTFWFVALACGALATLIIVWQFIEASTNSYGMDFISFGFYLGGLAAIGVLASAYMFRSPTDSIKSGFDSLKGDIDKKANSGTNGPGTV